MRKVRHIATALLISIAGVYLVSISNAKPIAPGLKVGVLVSDTGALGFVGSTQRAAARLAARDLSLEDRPVNVELSFVDVGDTDSERRKAFAKLKSFGVDVIIAPIESESTKALIASNEKSPVPVIAPASLEDDLGVTTTKPWLFRLATSPSQDSFALVKYIAKQNQNQTLIVSSSIPQSRAQMRSLAFGLVMNGVRVQTASISDTKGVAKAKPDNLVLLSMEESLPFLATLSQWVADVPQVYLVPGNLADYSLYPWAKALKGARALYPFGEVDPQFRAELAKMPGTGTFVGQRAATILSLGQRTYDALQIATEALLRAKSDNPDNLRMAISKAQIEGRNVFTRHGFLEETKYSIFQYGSSGTFNRVSVFSPN